MSLSSQSPAQDNVTRLMLKPMALTARHSVRCGNPSMAARYHVTAQGKLSLHVWCESCGLCPIITLTEITPAEYSDHLFP